MEDTKDRVIKELTPSKFYEIKKSSFIFKYFEARKTWLNFNHFYNTYVGNIVFRRDMEEKKPPVALDKFAVQELDLMIQWQKACKEKLNIDTSIKNLKNLTTKQKEEAFGLWGNIVRENATYCKARSDLAFHMWHVWTLPPASYKVLIAKYLAIGGITAVAGGLVFKFGYHLRFRKKLDSYYKQLYQEHPEYWPALKVKKE